MTDGTTRLSGLIGTRVLDATGRRLGKVRDLVVDLAGSDPGRVDPALPEAAAVVTGVLVGGPCVPQVLPWEQFHPVRDGTALQCSSAQSGDPGEIDLGPTQVLARRDLLDSPVVLGEPARRARIADVLLLPGHPSPRVVGVDLTTTGVLHRLFRRTSPAEPEVVDLADLHVVSPRGHQAQLLSRRALVHRAEPATMAEMLTRLPLTHAREVARVVDNRVLEEALELLHPHERGRLTGTAGPPRRWRRLSGWRLHRPVTAHHHR